MPLIIEIDSENASACTMEGGPIAGSEFESDMLDCTTTGDCQDACEYVLDQIGVEFRIVAHNAKGEYENRLATAEEKAATCKAIYFESETDFTDERLASIYLVWQAASDVENETGG